MSDLTGVQQEYLRLFEVMLLETELKLLRKEMRALVDVMCADAAVVPSGGSSRDMTLDYLPDFTEGLAGDITGRLS